MSLFKALIIFIMLTTLLYGTSNVWPAGAYTDTMYGLGPMTLD